MQVTEISLASYADAREISLLSMELIEYGLATKKYTEKRVRADIAHELKNVAVTKRGGSVAGFGIMTYQDSSANLDLLAVLPEFQGSGMARDIVAWLEKVASTAGIADIGVQARQKNKRAISFYRKLGYKLARQTPRVYSGETQVCMVKKLR